MFENIGGKLKSLAMIVCCLGIICSIILAIVLWAGNSRYYPTVGTGFGVLIGGCVLSYIGSMMTYAFGELVENSAQQVEQNAEAAQAQKEIIKQLQSLKEAKATSAPEKEGKEMDDVSLNMMEL